MQQKTILIVDDEEAQRETLSGYLKKKGMAVFTADNGKEALDITRNQLIDIILSDIRMPEITGLELLKQVKEINPDISVVMITAFGSIEDAVEAMKSGAEDYIQKPIDLNYLDIVIRKIIDKKRILSENRELKAALHRQYDFKQIISGSEKMEEVLNLAGRAAGSKASVLLRGESGTGKEIIARAIHFSGPRKNHSFIPVNVAAIPENLVESEFFGHEKGSFTGADRQRRGRFEQADQGTLFIDEIGDIPVASQVKLLRVLQEQSFERVGGSEVIDVNVRIIAATSQDLETMIKQGTFREDLYYRLNVVSVSIPPLRERREDIPLLIDHFLDKYRKQENKDIHSVSKEAMDILMKHDYPGNVRELENIIQRGVVMARTELVTTEDLPSSIGELTSEADVKMTGSLEQSVENLEKNMIRHALRESNGNQSQAARSLDISERTLRYKMKKYKMK